MPSQNVLSDGFTLLYFKTMPSQIDFIFELYSPILSGENMRSFGFLYLYCPLFLSITVASPDSPYAYSMSSSKSLL